MDEQNSLAQGNTEVNTGSTQGENTDTNTNTNTSEQEEKSTTSPETINNDELVKEEPKEEAKPPGAPEKYADFTLPEGFTAPVDEFKTWAKEQNLNQESAQSMVDFYIKNIVPQQEAERTATVEKWTEESKTKYGDKGIDTANKALGRFSTPEFKQFLVDTGLGNHPEMIGIFKSIGEKISESGLVEGTKKSAPSRMYPNSPEMYKD